jgi:hypothetical protein
MGKGLPPMPGRLRQSSGLRTDRRATSYGWRSRARCESCHTAVGIVCVVCFVCCHRQNARRFDGFKQTEATAHTMTAAKSDRKVNDQRRRKAVIPGSLLGDCDSTSSTSYPASTLHPRGGYLAKATNAHDPASEIPISALPAPGRVGPRLCERQWPAFDPVTGQASLGRQLPCPSAYPQRRGGE